MTWLDALSKATEEELNQDVTVELGQEEEIFQADLRICGKKLDEGRLVIYVP